MANELSADDLRTLLRAADLPAPEEFLAATLAELAILRDGLAALRGAMGDAEPANEFRLDPEGWR